MRQTRNVFETILKYGHDEDFAPVETGEFVATDAPAGSRDKLNILAQRIEMGLPLWHPEDRPDYSGLTGAVRPRDLTSDGAAGGSTAIECAYRPGFNAGPFLSARGPLAGRPGPAALVV